MQDQPQRERAPLLGGDEGVEIAIVVGGTGLYQRGLLRGFLPGEIAAIPRLEAVIEGYARRVRELEERVLKLANPGVVPAAKFIDIPARQVRKDAVDEFWTDLKAKTGKKG